MIKGHDNRDHVLCVMSAATAADLAEGILDDPLSGKAVSFVTGDLGELQGKCIVDVGCGTGAMSVFFALKGAFVIGLDVRNSSLSQARAWARRWEVADRCAFVCCPAETLPFDDETIDIVFSKSTLQYMNHEEALSEYRRVLCKSGTLRLIENLPHNPLVKAYRFCRRLLATDQEQRGYLASIRGYLTFGEIERLKSLFGSVSHAEFHLFRVLTIAVKGRSKWLDLLDAALARIDQVMLRVFPLSRYLGWITGIVCSKKM